MAAISYLIWLTTRKGIRADIAVGLLRYFGTAEAVYQADAGEYERISVPRQLCRSLMDKKLADSERILEQCDRQGISILTCQDAAYPERLHQLDDRPPVLYVKGTLPRIDGRVSIGVVGSRECTPYGETMAGRISAGLARSGVVLVSGMAQGIDAAALKGALHGGGQTISVLAGGVDVVYPACNRRLYQEVQTTGAVISENPPGTRPDGWRFPIRNRIISGLSLGILVVEAVEKRSGSLITAHAALDQGRDVFAVPGPADAPMSAGTNRLIGQGEAKLVRRARDILEEYAGRYPLNLNPSPPEPKKEEKIPPEPQAEELPVIGKQEFRKLGDEQQEIIKLLEGRQLTAEELVDCTDIPPRRVNTALTVLQSQGYLKELSGRRYTAAVRFDKDR